jgi:hypothetical protein
MFERFPSVVPRVRSVTTAKSKEDGKAHRQVGKRRADLWNWTQPCHRLGRLYEHGYPPFLRRSEQRWQQSEDSWGGLKTTRNGKNSLPSRQARCRPDWSFKETGRQTDERVATNPRRYGSGVPWCCHSRRVPCNRPLVPAKTIGLETLFDRLL